MRSSFLLGCVVAVSIVATGCSSSDMGGTGGSSGATGGSGGGQAGGTGGQAGGHAGAGGQGGAPAPTDCSPPCSAGSVCVGSGVQGGAVFFADAGVCPQGRHAQGDVCVQDLSYACMPMPSACNGTLSCACASATLCTQGHLCNVQSPTELTCIEAVP